MERKEKKLLHLKFGLAILKILDERKGIARSNKEKGIKDHKLISSLRKLAAASSIDYGTVQKISKGDQGFEFFTFIELIEALDLDMISFGKYFSTITPQEIKEYSVEIIRNRKETPKKKKK